MAQIKLSIEDIKNQQIRMSSLAERLNAQTERYNTALKRLKDATEGRYSLNMAAKATVTLKMMRELTDNIRMGAQVAQTCIDRFQATDTDLANKTNPANPENVMKETIPAYGSVLASSGTSNATKTENGISSQVMRSGSEYSYKGENFKVSSNLIGSFDFNQHNSDFDNNGSEACAATSIKIMYEMSGTHVPDDWGKQWQNNGWVRSDGLIENWDALGIKQVSYSNTSDLGQAIYDKISEGQAIRFWPKLGHAVTIVGVRQDADVRSLTSNDLLIMDPADGRVKLLSEEKSYIFSAKWSIGYIYKNIYSK